MSDYFGTYEYESGMLRHGKPMDGDGGVFIPAMLSNGEYVIRASSVARYLPHQCDEWEIGGVDQLRQLQTAAWNAAVQVYGELSPDQLHVHPAGVVICADPQDPSRALARLAIRVDTTQEPS